MILPTSHTHADPAYDLQVWSYSYAPYEYRALFEIPDPEHISFIVRERRLVDSWMLEWVTPNGVWWTLWYLEAVHDLGDNTKVYLLIDKLKS